MMRKKRRLRLRQVVLAPLLLMALATLLPACARVTLDQAKPLEINVNVRLQIDRELDEFFAFQNRDGTPATGGPTTQPTTQPAAGS